MQQYDAVVIGAGNAGLTAAATLAKSGVNVLLLERHNIPGGCATSFCRGRFEFETALHQLSGVGTEANPGPLRPVLSNLDVFDKVDFIVTDELYRAVVPGAFDVTLKADRQTIIDELQRQFPHEKKRIAEFFDFLYAFVFEAISVFHMKTPSPTAEDFPRLFQYLFKSTQEVLEEHLSDPHLIRVLTAYWGYMGLPPSLLPFFDWARMFVVYIEYKPQHIKGCSQALSNALADTILTCGGEIRYNCGAQRIIVEDGEVRGVVTEHGDEIAARAVISNASKLTTYVDLIGAENLPAGVLEDMRGRKPSASAVTVYVGFDCSPEELGITHATTFLSTAADAQREYEATKVLGFVEDSMILMTCYTKMDPSFSLPGTTVAAIIILQYAEPWLQLPPQEYVKEKYRAANAMIDRAEMVYPGLRNHIEEIEISTPITHMRYLGHPAGSFYGFDQHFKNSDVFVSPASPIEGLYLAGAWVAMGGFHPTLEAGAKTAKRALRKLKGLGRQ